MNLYRILNAGDYFPAGEYKRRWFENGVARLIGKGCIMELQINTVDGEPEPVLHMVTADGRIADSPLPCGHHLDARPFAHLYIIPRAAEMDDQGLPRRALIEFIAMDRGQSLAVL